MGAVLLDLKSWRAYLQGIQETVERFDRGVTLLCSSSENDILQGICGCPDEIFSGWDEGDAVEVRVDGVFGIVDLVCGCEEGGLCVY
jgi:hypothetical protein